VKEHLPLFPIIKEVNSHLPLLLLVVSQKDVDELRGLHGMEIEIRKESPTIASLYDYLHASDILILHRNPCDGVVVSSAAFQCLGSGCPILARQSPFFETLGDVVVTYSDFREFKESLLDLLQRGKKYQVSQRGLEEFIKRNSAEEVAKKYIDLFRAMDEERKQSMFSKASSIIGGMAPIPAEIASKRPNVPAIRGLQELSNRRLQPH
jgi:glycosyltransferase involved in cell wall biosynthesis